MADSQEEVLYSFEGDVSSLRQATQSAIAILDKYDSAIKAIASRDAFSASKTSVTGFTKALNGITKQVNSLTTALNTTGSSIDEALPDGAAAVTGVASTLATVLELLDQSTKITSSDLKMLAGALNESKSGLDALVPKAQLFATTLTPLKQLNEVAAAVKGVGAAAQGTQTQLDTAADSGTKIQSSYEASAEAATKAASVFEQMEHTATGLTTVQYAVQHIRSELQQMGASASQAWAAYSAKLDPVTSKIQSFKDKASESLNRVKSVLERLGHAFKKTPQSVDDSGDSFSRLSVRSQTLADALRNLYNRTRASSNQFKILNSVSNTLSRAFGALTGVRIGDWIASAASESINFAENLNLFTVAMGDAVDVGHEFVAQMSEVYGMDPSNLMRYAGNFYQLADAIDMPDEAASNLSLSLVKATNDISSLFNVPIETVFNDLSSGMQGMSRAVRKYGMDIRATTLQQTALSLGITESVETMSEANRQGLRYITMMRQAGNASGDFARTIESPANQLKIFKEQMAVLGRSIGSIFIGPLTTAISFVNGLIMALSTAISFIAAFFGIFNSLFGGSSADVADSADNVAESIDGIGGAAGGAAKKLQQMLAPFDELNVLQDQAAGGGGGGGGGEDLALLDPAIAAEIEAMELQLENVRMKAVETRDAILEFFGFTVQDGEILSWSADSFEQNLIEKFPDWTKTIQAAFDNWSSIVESFKSLFNAIGEVVDAVWQKILAFFSLFINDDTVSTFITNLAGNVQGLADAISQNADTIANFIIAIGAIVAVAKGLTALYTFVQPILAVVQACSSVMAPLAGTIAVIGAVVAAIAVLYKNSESFAVSFDTLLSSVATSTTGIFDTALLSMQAVGTSLQTLWESSIQPMIAEIGDGLAPMLGTLTALWEDLAIIISSVFDLIAQIWVADLEPLLTAFFGTIQSLAEIFGTLWSGAVGPVFERIGESLSTLWNTVLSPIIANIISIISGIIEIVLLLWNKTLAPLVNFVVAVWGPQFASVFNFVWGVAQQAIDSIGTLLNGLLTIINGVIEFVAGVFTLDWTRAWEGIVSIFVAIFDSIVEAIKIPLNGIIGVVNSFLAVLTGAINGVIGGINSISITIPDWVPIVGGSVFSPNVAPIGSLEIPYLASGGVVTSPTMAMVGEGKYDEAVIPLGNSPQMRDLVNQISEATKNNNNAPIQVCVYIGNEQVAEYMHRADQRALLQTNGGV